MEDNQMETTISLQDLLSLLWKNVILILTITFILTAAVGLYSKYGIEPKYASDTTLRVTVDQSNDSINYNDLQTSQKLVKTYSVIATSRTVLNHVITELNLQDLGYTYNSLKNSIEVTSVQDTDIIQITVTLTDKVLAKNIANKLANIFMEEVKNQFNNIDTLTILDEAIVNDSVVSPNLKLNIVIGFVLGLMISVGFVLLKAFLDRTIKNDDDVEKYLKVPVLGFVPCLDKQYVK